ncbi:MAG: hypothetical protein AAB066_05190 [Candidatus Margulisiibacteriota bacterium]
MEYLVYVVDTQGRRTPSNYIVILFRDDYPLGEQSIRTGKVSIINNGEESQMTIGTFVPIPDFPING